MSEIREVSHKEAGTIIATQEPLGLFLETDGNCFVGIDNSGGQAWIEEFHYREDCERWLRREFEMGDDDQALDRYEKPALLPPGCEKEGRAG